VAGVISIHLVSIVLAAVALVLALNEKEGWGWCLFLIFLIEVHP
jgi:hypothetical protein